MKKGCDYCSAPKVPIGGSIDYIEEAPDCECEMEKQLEKIKNPTAKVYKNHCWKCKSKIDSRVCQHDPKRDHGYICKTCGTSLIYPKR